jgi:hypothetical protein
MQLRLTFLLNFFIVATTFAQEIPVLEKSHDVSRKARKGYLGQVVPNATKGTFDMIYVIKGGGKNNLRTETYTFDKELKLLDTKKEDHELEVARKRYKWMTYRGDELSFVMTSGYANLKGELVFRKRKITQHFDWWWGEYRNIVKLLDKEKAEDEAGVQYMFHGGIYNNYVNGNMYALAIPKDIMKDKGMVKFDIISADGNLKIQKTDEIQFDGSKMPIYCKPLTDEQSSSVGNDDLPRDWVVIFAPEDKKGQTLAPTDLTYVRISPEGKVLEKVAMTAPTNGWHIMDVIEKNNVVTLVGASQEKNKEKKFYDEMFKMSVPMTSLTKEEQEANTNEKGTGAAKAIGGSGLGSMIGGIRKMSAGNLAPTQEMVDDYFEEKKYDHFVIGQIKNGAYATTSYPDMDEFNAARQKPEGQDDFYEFDGKKFTTDFINVNNDGSIDITAQDFYRKKGNKIFDEAYLFRFGADGKLKANYGVEVDVKLRKGLFGRTDGPQPDHYDVRNILMQNAAKTNTFWFMKKVKKVEKRTDTDFDFNMFSGTSTTTTYISYNPWKALQYGIIDNATMKMGPAKDLGDDEKRNYYLFQKHNTVILGNYTIFLNETMKGDKILLSRFDLK